LGAHSPRTRDGEIIAEGTCIDIIWTVERTRLEIFIFFRSVGPGELGILSTYFTGISRAKTEASWMEIELYHSHQYTYILFVTEASDVRALGLGRRKRTLDAHRFNRLGMCLALIEYKPCVIIIVLRVLHI
jgi:hypothetical protein